MELDVEVGQEKIASWDKVCCTECDASIGFLPPEIKFHGDELPIYCFQCAVNLDVKDN